MASPEEYQDRIQKLDKPQLIDLWEQVLDRAEIDGWPLGIAFEYLVIRAFQIEGVQVTWPYRVTLASETVEQIDGAIRVNDIFCLIESKDRRDPLNIEPIAKMRNQLLRRPSFAIGSTFSRSGYTSPAKTMAQFIFPQTILLWEGTEFDLALRNSSMVEGFQTKLRYAVEYAVPDFNLLIESI